MNAMTELTLSTKGPALYYIGDDGICFRLDVTDTSLRHDSRQTAIALALLSHATSILTFPNLLGLSQPISQRDPAT